MNDVDEVLVEQLGAVGLELGKLVTWWGMTLETMPPADDLLDATQDFEFPADDEKALVAFYEGEQWPAGIKALRQREQRPTLVVNRLPELVAMALSRRHHPNINEFRLMLVITRQNRDAQLAYNYVVSAAVEAAMRASGTGRTEA